MCKIKDYTQQMEEMNSSVAFRFDFYSMPSFRNTFVESVKEKLQIRDFTERLLTEEEKQTINIDALCSVLDNSIDEVVSKKVYKMVCTTPGDDSLELYISPYFLFVIYSRTEENKQIPWEILQTITSLLVEREGDIDLQNTSCHVLYQKKTDETQLWDIFDHEAFPTLDTGAMTVGRYADKHKYGDNVTVELVRIIKIGKFKLSDDEVIDPYFCININSISNSNGDTFLENPNIQNLYDIACKEATKCFK